MSGLSYEIGIGAGSGQTFAQENYSNIDSQKTDKSGVLQAYILARNPWIGAELGFMKLPEYHSKSYTSDYPAYKGLPPGTYPQTLQGQQDITASGLYGRLNLYGPTMFNMEPYGFYGRAKVSTKNHEHAIYNGVEEADFKQNLVRTSPYYGVGMNLLISKDAYLRAEYGKIPHGTVDYHTLDRNINMGLIGLGMRF